MYCLALYWHWSIAASVLVGDMYWAESYDQKKSSCSSSFAIHLIETTRIACGPCHHVQHQNLNAWMYHWLRYSTSSATLPQTCQQNSHVQYEKKMLVWIIVLNLLISASCWANQLRNLPVPPQQEFVDGWLVFWCLGTFEPLYYGIIELMVVEYIIDDSPCSTWGQEKMNLVPFISSIAQGQCDSGCLLNCYHHHPLVGIPPTPHLHGMSAQRKSPALSCSS